VSFFKNIEMMMNVLHIDSSVLGSNSVSRELTAAIVQRLQAQQSDVTVDYLDLAAQPIAHLTGESLAKVDPVDAALSEQLIEQYLAADTVVIGAPMYNFSIPSTLKAWIDRIAVAGRTFKYTETGPIGLSGDKKVIIASGRGGLYGDKNPADFQEDYLRTLFGFLGVKNIEFVRAEGIAYSPQHRTDALIQAHAEIAALAV
jgi:FMN-dependent NADH-azoreductase